MKAFEKWFDEHITAALAVYPTLPVEQLKNRYEKVWRAALKHVRNDICPEAWGVGDVEDFIEEELEKK